MAFLHNRISRKELRQRLESETEPRLTASFYRYFAVSDPGKFRDDWYLALHGMRVLGRIYVAREGINAQISVPVSQWETLGEFVLGTPGLEGLLLNRAVQESQPSFWVLTIKVRKKIVADGIDDPSFDISQKGLYLDAQQFNQLTDDPGTIVVDMRNHYEYEVGHFEGALELPSDTFREQLPLAVELLFGKEERPLIMYCTGGIRCEKASAYLRHRGFQQVYHLEGGIIGYAHEVREKNLRNKFLGRNFVFDGRMGERIGEGIIARCHQCGAPCDRHVNCALDGCHLLFIQCESCARQYSGCCSLSCAASLRDPGSARKAGRRGHRIFHKAKQRLESLPKP
jgi:UPF0176 protein